MGRGIPALIDILRSSFTQLSGLFVLLVLAQGLGLLPGGLGLPALSFVLPILAVLVLISYREVPQPPLPLVSVLLVVAFAVALALRLGPSLGNEVLLGYDPGLYKHLMDLYLQGLPGIPEGSLPEWIRSNYPQGLPVLGTVAYLVPGLTPEELMRYAFPILGAAVVFPIYLLGREVFGQRAAIIGAFLYAVSYTQFSMFTLMYLKNGVALFLLALALYSLHRRSYALFGVLLAGIAIYHRPTLVVMAAFTLAYLLATRQRWVLVGILVAAVLAAPFYLTRLAPNWDVLRSALDVSLSNVGQQATTGGGTFFSLERYRWVSLAYQPFAMIGAVYLIYRRRWNAPLLFLVGSAALVVLQVAFFRRHLVPLDAAMLLLAGLGVEVVFVRAGRRGMALGVVAILAIVVAAAVPTWEEYRDTKPLVTPQQLEAVQWLAANTPPTAGVVVANHDAPWALGWSERRVIAPGLFQWNRHNREQWQQFLGTEDVEVAREFLSQYEGPLYVYYAETPASYLAEEKFQPPLFRKVYDQGGARIYAYSPPSSTSTLR